MTASLILYHQNFLELKVHQQKFRAMAQTKKKTPSQKSRVVIEDIEPVGNYAVAIKFDDGHNTGIFSWSYLQKLSLEKDKLWKDYLKRVEDLKIER
jgi:DUF971 family protein